MLRNTEQLEVVVHVTFACKSHRQKGLATFEEGASRPGRVGKPQEGVEERIRFAVGRFVVVGDPGDDEKGSRHGFNGFEGRVVCRETTGDKGGGRE